MKKVMVVLLAALLTIGLALPIFGSGTGTSLGYSIQNTKTPAAGSTFGYVNTSVSGPVTSGSDVTITFGRDNFNWSGTAGDPFRIGKFDATSAANWIRLTTSPNNSLFTFKSAVVNEANGDLLLTYTVRSGVVAGNYNYSIQLFGGTATAPNVVGLTNGLTNQVITIQDAVSTLTRTLDTGTAPTLTSHSGSNVSLQIGDKLVYNFPSNNFQWSSSTGAKDASAFSQSWINVSGATVGTDFSVGYTPKSNGDMEVTLTALKAATYNNLSVSLQGGSGGAATKATTPVTAAVANQNVESTIKNTVSVGTAPTLTSHTGTNLSLVPGDKLTFRFPFDNFTWDPANGAMNASKLTNTDWIKLSGANKGTDFSVAYSTPAGTSGAVDVTLTALKAATYNNLSVSLQGGTGGTATKSSASIKVTVTSAGGSTKINGISSNAQLGDTWSGALLDGKTISLNDLGSLDINGGEEILIPLEAGFFTWEGTAPYAYSAVTAAQLRTGKITVSSSSKKGNQVFDKSSPEIVTKNNRAYIKVKFIEDMTSTKDVDFSMTVYLAVNKSRHTGSQVEIAGTYIRDVVEVDSDNDYADISDGTVIEPTEYVRNIELYLGNGVYMHANLFANTKYSGTAKFEVSRTDQQILDDFPSIEMVVVLKVNNLDRRTNKVTFDYADNYYVYDQNGIYLGRSKDKLPYSAKYYLSTKYIDPGEGSTPTNPGGNGGDPGDTGTNYEPPPAPGTDNPYTGRQRPFGN